MSEDIKKRKRKNFLYKVLSLLGIVVMMSPMFLKVNRWIFYALGVIIAVYFGSKVEDKIKDE